MKRQIENEYDYMVAQAEAATDNARRALDNARSANDYWKEKAAAKLLAFAEHDEKAVRLYAEAKTGLPALGEIIDGTWKHYKSRADEARGKLGSEQSHG